MVMSVVIEVHGEDGATVVIEDGLVKGVSA